MDPISNRPLSALDSTVSFKTVSTSNKPNPLPEDIRLRFSYYASEIKNQVDTFYDDQHKWLEDHLLGVQDTFANIKQKKRGTRAAMADIIKTPSRKRIQASSKKKITQPEPLRFEQSGTSDRATVSMKSLPPSKIEKSQTGINFIPAFGSSKRHDEKENPAGSLVPSKAHYDLHSAASDRFATSHNKEVTPSVLGEVQNVSHLHNSRQEPSASNSGSTSRDQTSRVFQPIIAPTLLKGLGLSSSTQMSQTYTASGASHHGILNQEEVAALSKSYSSPFKKSTLANPPSSVTLTQPFVTSQSVPGSTSVDRVAKDDEPSARKVVVYTTTSLQHPTVDGDCDEETHDHSGEDTELEEEALEGHELSAIQEGEEEEDPAATERHIPRGSAKKTRKEEQPNPNIHTTAQKAKISLPKPTNPSQPTSRGSSDRSPQVTSDSIALQPAAKLSKSLKSVPDLHVEPDAAFEDSVREDTAPLQAAVASLHDTLPKSQDDTILAQEDLAHHRDRVTPSEDIHDTAVEASVDQEVVHETNAVHSSPNRDNVAKYRSDLPESSRAPALSSCESHPQRQRERDNSHSLPIEHKDLHEDSHAPTSDAKAVHTIPDAPECRNQKITSPERPQAIPTSQALKTSKPAVSRSSKTTTALAEHVSTPEADEEPLAETNDVQSERLQFSLPDQNITAEIPLNDDPSRLRNTRAIQSQAFDNNTRTPGPTTQSLFTPGNTRAALIHSPQSQWSSKPTNSGWLNKPHKTPGLAYGALGLGIEKSEVSRFQGVGGSPVATNKPDPRPSFTSHATNLARAQDIGSQANTISDSQRMLANQRRSSKRTSTDAGFPYTSETQEAKIARPYVPVPHRYVPSTADKGKKGVDDLKNRLSKIQRESAMHERTQQVLPMVEPLHMVQRASLATSATSASVVHGKPLIAQSSQTSHSTSTMPPWAPMPPWNAADLNNLNKSQSSRPPASQISSQHRTVSPASLPSFTTYAGVPLIDRGASSETTHSLHNKASNPPVGLYADSTDSQLPVKKTSVGDLVAAYESKKKPDEPAVNVSSVARNTSPAPSVTLTHETKSKSPVDTAPLNIKSTALLRSTTPTATPPVLRVDKEARRIVTQPEIPKDDAQGAMEKESQDGGSAVSEHYEKDLIDLNGKSNRPSHPTLNLPDVEVDANEDDEDEVDESQSERQDDWNESDGVEATGASRDRDEQVENEDSLSDCSELSPSASNFQDAYASAPSQSSRHASNAGNVTPPLDEGTEARTPPTSGIMSVFKAGAALATSWTSTKKPELKSLQLAAVAAKKELDDKERKNAIKEEREQRRLALLEKKQAEEREKEEADRKARAAEADRKKKEREESSKARQTVKAKPAPAATPGHHRDVSSAGDLAKKRKVEADTSRVMDPKKAKPQKPEPISPARVAPGSALKTSSSSSFQPSRVAPAAPAAPGSVKSLNKYRVAAASVGVKTMIEPIKITHPTPASSSSKAFQPARQSKLPKPSVAGSSKSKLSAVAPPAALKPNAPSATPKINPTDPKGKKKSEEYVELPDIDSEYSDDDEEEHQRKEAALPDWAQTMVIKDALANQRKMNPNDIFGTTIPAPPMEEIFRGRASRFRHRTSSANWTGTDQLTALEEAEYAKRMGYHQKQQRRTNKDK